MGKARSKYFGCKRQKAVVMPEQTEEDVPNPMKRDDWVAWLELQRELEEADVAESS